MTVMETRISKITIAGNVSLVKTRTPPVIAVSTAYVLLAGKDAPVELPEPSEASGVLTVHVSQRLILVPVQKFVVMEKITTVTEIPINRTATAGSVSQVLPKKLIAAVERKAFVIRAKRSAPVLLMELRKVSGAITASVFQILSQALR
jgi:hypothetical protein